MQTRQPGLICERCNGQGTIRHLVCFLLHHPTASSTQGGAARTSTLAGVLCRLSTPSQPPSQHPRDTLRSRANARHRTRACRRCSGGGGGSGGGACNPCSHRLPRLRILPQRQCGGDGFGPGVPAAAQPLPPAGCRGCAGRRRLGHGLPPPLPRRFRRVDVHQPWGLWCRAACRPAGGRRVARALRAPAPAVPGQASAWAAAAAVPPCLATCARHPPRLLHCPHSEDCCPSAPALQGAVPPAGACHAGAGSICALPATGPGAAAQRHLRRGSRALGGCAQPQLCCSLLQSVHHLCLPVPRPAPCCRPTGLNTVVQSWRGRLGPGDAVFSLDLGYGSVKRMLQARHRKRHCAGPCCGDASGGGAAAAAAS